MNRRESIPSPGRRAKRVSWQRSLVPAICRCAERCELARIVAIPDLRTCIGKMPDPLQGLSISRFVLQPIGLPGPLEILGAIDRVRGQDDLSRSGQANREAQHAERMAAAEIEDADLIMEIEVAFV